MSTIVICRGRWSATTGKFPDTVLPGTFGTGFRLSLMLKDVNLALAEAKVHAGDPQLDGRPALDGGGGRGGRRGLTGAPWRRLPHGAARADLNVGPPDCRLSMQAPAHAVVLKAWRRPASRTVDSGGDCNTMDSVRSHAAPGPGAATPRSPHSDWQMLSVYQLAGPLKPSGKRGGVAITARTQGTSTGTPRP